MSIYPSENEGYLLDVQEARVGCPGSIKRVRVSGLGGHQGAESMYM